MLSCFLNEAPYLADLAATVITCIWILCGEIVCRMMRWDQVSRNLRLLTLDMDDSDIKQVPLLPITLKLSIYI